MVWLNKAKWRFLNFACVKINNSMTQITDDFMKQMIASAKPYTALILKIGPNYKHPDVMSIIWEHGRRNFSLQEEGKLAIVCPVNDGSNVAGIAIFDASLEETKKIMDEDPAIKEGVFEYEAHETRSFPGDKLE
jgi:uncharacterized protein YciI